MSVDAPDASDLLASLRAVLGDFTRDRVRPMEIDRTGRMPPELLEDLAELGVFGVTLPERHGGSGLGLSAACTCVSVLAETDRSVATTVGLHLGLGTRAMVAFGSHELQERVLPDLASGRHIAAFAATEAGAGSDLRAVATRARQGSEGWVVDGTKIFVTNGGLASVFTVLASTPGAGGRRKGFSLLQLGAEDGLEIGPEEHKLGLRGSSTTSVVMDGVTVPQDRIIGRAGHGMAQLDHVLAWGRTVMAAGCTGSATSALRIAREHTALRRQFGKSLDAFPLVQEQIADARALLFAMRAMLDHAASASAEELADASLAAKVVCSEGNGEICDRAIQLCGGWGFIEESGLPLLARDARVTRIFEGANDVLLILAGTAEATARRPRLPLAGAMRTVGREADALADRIDAQRACWSEALGARLLLQQSRLHRLGWMRVLRASCDAAVFRARGLGTPEAAELARHWIDLAGRRVRTVQAEPKAAATLARLAGVAR